MAKLPFATRIVMRLDVCSVRWTGRSFFMWAFAQSARLAGDPHIGRSKAHALILVTKGRKSGRRRSVVLPYFPISGKTLVVASKGGAADDPDWLENLRVTPAALIYIDRRRRSVTTRIANKVERSSYWPQLIALAPTYEAYQQKTRREIPLVIID